MSWMMLKGIQMHATLLKSVCILVSFASSLKNALYSKNLYKKNVCERACLQQNNNGNQLNENLNQIRKSTFSCIEKMKLTCFIIKYQFLMNKSQIRQKTTRKGIIYGFYSQNTHTQRDKTRINLKENLDCLSFYGVVGTHTHT